MLQSRPFLPLVELGCVTEIHVFRDLPRSYAILGLIGLVSAGLGYGDFILTTLLFPFPILFAKLITPFVGCPEFGDCFPRDHLVFLVALLQFPTYCMRFSLLSHRKLLAAGIAIFHLVFFFVFYILMDPLGPRWLPTPTA